MKLQSSDRVDGSSHGRLTVRESVAGRIYNAAWSVLIIIVFFGGGVVAGGVWFSGQMPADVPRGLLYVGVPVSVLFGLLAIPPLRASFRRTNWLLQVRPQGLVIKFRSDSNARLPEPHPVILELDFDEIQWARLTREYVRVQGLGSDSSSGYNADILDMKLNLGERDVETLRQAIAAEINFKPGPGFTLHHHYPVRMDGEVLRVQWWWFVRPRVRDLLKKIRFKVRVEKELNLVKDLRGFDANKNPDDLILELKQRGEFLPAVALVRKAYGMSLAEAKELVEGI